MLNAIGSSLVQLVEYFREVPGYRLRCHILVLLSEEKLFVEKSVNLNVTNFPRF